MSLFQVALAAAFSLLFTLIVPIGPAEANEGEPMQIIHAAQNEDLWVGADSEGQLFWTEDAGSTWNQSNFGLSKSGVSSIIWNGEYFLAASYFEAARSTDGKSWVRFMLPVGSAFDPGNLISDDQFFRAASMSVDQIQDFLEMRNPQCRDGFVCLRDYKENTFTRDSTVLCGAYEGSQSESAASILHKVSAACGVSVEALLVLIQKEQSLVTSSSPSLIRFQRAAGYACPDTAPCDSRYFGFYNQVYNAAKQFKRYSNPPGTSRFFTWFPIGREIQVRLHPRVSCGTATVLMKNQATAGLHYYTPYTPNYAALQNLSSAGDNCSSYGNRNFWRIYNYWFNPQKDFKTMATSKDGVTMVVDVDGTIASSTSLENWSRLGTVPGGGPGNRVSEFGQTADGKYAVLLADGRAFESSSGTNWEELEVVTTEVPQDIVIQHVVQSGDTVWAISRANGVSVETVVAENRLERGGELIRVGQRLTITKTGSVTTVSSPVMLDSSIVISASRTSEQDAPETDNSNTPSNDENSSGEVPDQYEDSVEASDPDGEQYDSPLVPLKPIVTRTETNDIFYSVEKGDTLTRIAFRNETTVSRIVAENNIQNPDRIYVRQRLKVGVSEVVTTYHESQEGDTFARIAERRSVSTSSLVDLNPGVSPQEVIPVGQLIRLS